MSLEHELPILMKKTQMSGDRAQCGLTSLLPMSCRGRAEAFARRLHTRLRNLGSASGEPGESRWLASRDLSTANRRESDLFFDFELECESPSSPVDEYDAPFQDRSPSDDVDAPFYDVDSEPDATRPTENAELLKKRQDGQPKTSPPLSNGFTFSSAFYADRSPIKSQPAPRENGHTDGRLYSAINFDDCERHDSLPKEETDVTDSAARRGSPPRYSPAHSPTQHSSPVLTDISHLPAPFSSADSDSDFESAKSDFDVAVEALETDVDIKPDDDTISDRLSELSLRLEDPSKDNNHIEVAPSATENIDTYKTDDVNADTETTSTLLEIKTDEILGEKESSPAPEEDPMFLCAELALAEVDEEAEDRPQRVRRCSSLKTGKTPPGTPGRKKIVRFADVLGLDLADVKTFMDEIPVIPKSAYEDLSNADLAIGSPPARSPALQRLGALCLAPLFQPPRDINEALEARCVCLESARVADGTHITVCGSVRVRNLDFHKTVHVRYTMDGWKTYTDLQATYVPASCDGFSDRFQFVLYAPSISAGQRLEFAVRFQCKGRQYWDSNFGANYCYDCLPLGAPAHAGVSAASPLHPTRDWHPSFY